MSEQDPVKGDQWTWAAPGGQQPAAPTMPGAPHYGPPPVAPPPAPAQQYSQYGPPPVAPPVGQPGYGAASATPTYRSWQPGIIPLRPLGFGDFIGVPFKAMRFNRAVVLGGPLLFMLLATVLSVAAGWLVWNDPQLGLQNPVTSFNGIEPQTIALIVAAIIALLLADIFSTAIVAPGVARAVLGERLSLGGAWKLVRRRFGSVLLLYVYVMLITGVSIVLGVLPAILMAGTDASGVGVLLTVLLMLVIVPALIAFSMVASVARPIVVLEDRGAGASLARSWRLMKGRFWWTVLIVIVTGLIIQVASTVFQYAGQFGALIVTAAVPDNVTVLVVAFTVIVGATLIVSYVLTYAYLGSVFSLIYIDLRMRHEGFELDLARAAEARAATR